MVVDVDFARDDIDFPDRDAVERALIELARDNITRSQSSSLKDRDKFKIPLA